MWFLEWAVNDICFCRPHADKIGWLTSLFHVGDGNLYFRNTLLPYAITLHLQ